MWLGLQTVSSLERCPLFRVPFIERFHCIGRAVPLDQLALKQNHDWLYFIWYTCNTYNVPVCTVTPPSLPYKCYGS